MHPVYSEASLESLTFRLRNIAFQHFEAEHVYQDIISPFSRIYLVKTGSGILLAGSEKTILEPGYLYLVPSFTFCTYQFHPGLSQYYIHVSIDYPGGMDPSGMVHTRYKTEAGDLENRLFERLILLHPGLDLPHDNPKVYQTKLWLNKKVVYDSPGNLLETIGILTQLFSRFIDTGLTPGITNMAKYKIQPVLHYIQTHLGEEITVDKLGEIACLSKDHFSRVFKSITGYSPCDYVIRKRIERAQFLLLTTHMSQKEIIEMTGFKSASYFSRIFRKQTSRSPAKYRMQQGQSF